MKKAYHDYVFKNNKFVGKFEEMYQNEDLMGYCSWYQDDMRDLGYQLSLSILNQYNFEHILDIGCGEGLFTSFLKKKNNCVIGIDVSETAIKKAKGRFEDIDFFVRNVNNDIIAGRYDLVVIKEVLSYIERWKKVLKNLTNIAPYIFISLDLPEKPIGFVKSFEELVKEVKKYYDIIVQVEIETKGNQMLILGKVKK